MYRQKPFQPKINKPNNSAGLSKLQNLSGEWSKKPPQQQQQQQQASSESQSPEFEFEMPSKLHKRIEITDKPIFMIKYSGKDHHSLFTKPHRNYTFDLFY